MVNIPIKYVQFRISLPFFVPQSSISTIFSVPQSTITLPIENFVDFHVNFHAQQFHDNFHALQFHDNFVHDNFVDFHARQFHISLSIFRYQSAIPLRITTILSALHSFFVQIIARNYGSVNHTHTSRYQVGVQSHFREQTFRGEYKSAK